jgi:hypothetical protein
MLISALTVLLNVCWLTVYNYHGNRTLKDVYNAQASLGHQ